MNYTAKRILDIILGGLAFFLASPLIIMGMAMVRLFMGSPVLFRQERAGRRGRIFRLYKLRTMNHKRDATGRLLPDAQRLAPVGSFLRRTSLDELLSLFNVLKGDMSLVGPRPLLPVYVGRYSPEEARRLEVKPGITGWAQINGRNAISWEQRFILDVWYVDRQSISLDLRIMARTIWLVLTGRGISASGHETMPEFTGKKQG